VNPTLRQGGLHMARVQITYRYITAWTVARAIIDSNEETGVSLSRKKIEEILRHSLEFSGQNRLDWLQDKVDDDVWAERLPWATEQIRRHWPQWADEVGEG
jgi:hypothetical protein